ncbi:MBL fold metallo-hydrolase [Corynebacterium callunae]|uniref:MBL fold metallo-hydrolase n=1 Tax=Corynebacterium callunae TaxID=1721 RepID=UPI0039823B5E
MALQKTPVRHLISVAASAALVLGLVSCSSAEQQQPAETEAASTSTVEDNSPYREAKTENLARVVSENFPQTPTVISDPGYSGIETSKMFFDSSETVVVAGAGISQELRAASIGVVAHAPVLHAPGSDDAAVIAEIERLGATTVLLVGNALPGFDENSLEKVTTVIQDPGTEQALAELTSLQFEEKTVVDISEVTRATAQLVPEEQTLLVPAWEKMPADTSAEKVEAFPVQTKRDGEMAPVVIASPESGISAVATARAYGAEVRFMDYPDPRLNTDTMNMVAGLSDKPLLALGDQFGSSELLSEKIVRGETITTELPGGGGLVFPGRRMVALYGHPSGPALGAMGEQPPTEAVARVKDMAAQYQEFEEQPVIPAFEVIATVASEFPGDDGNFSNEFAAEELTGYIDAITEAGGYAVIDLQPGRASFLEQAKLYEDLLKRPNVGLALDPEWKIGPDEQPMTRVGSATAAEINETAQWLADLTEANQLPQKALVLHQFQTQMLPDRENIKTDYAELAFVLHADGHGMAGDKYATWDLMRAGLSPNYFMAWKNFYDEDFPTFTPQQTYEEVNPRPWFVSYQ